MDIVRTKHWLVTAGASTLMMGLVATGSPSALAQDTGTGGTNLFFPPVDIHSGTCADPVAEPAYDAGNLSPIPVYADDDLDVEDDELFDDDDVFEDDELFDVDAFEDDAEIADFDAVFADGIFDDADEGFLSEDLDGDGIFEVGYDLDADDALDDGEILGEDVDESGALEAPEVFVFAPALPLQSVWKADTETDFDGTELVREGPYVVAVHESAENYENIVACGEVQPLVEEDLLVVPLNPVGGSNFSGVALIGEDEGEFAAYLWQGGLAGGPAAGTPSASS